MIRSIFRRRRRRRRQTVPRPRTYDEGTVPEIQENDDESVRRGGSAEGR